MAIGACPLTKLDKILISTDGSEAAKFAAQAAVDLAKPCGSTVYAICVAEVPIFAAEFVETLPQVIDVMEKRAKQALDDVKAIADKAGVKCETISYTGPEPYKYIIDEAIKNSVDLIILGKKGVMLGAVGKKVIGNAPCKVLVVPVGATLNFDKILIATDGSVYSNIAASEAIGTAKRFNSELIAVSVAKRDSEVAYAEEAVKAVKESGEREGVKVQTVVAKGEPFEQIADVANKNAVGLIVMGTYGKTGIEKFFMGSVTERVIGTVARPVMVVKKK
ncbi:MULTISPECIES: universal stress protein [Thermodesulfovibrio]|jgi:nucleotide-binding universal stress UspA family protein|uniref:Universal stress protein n=1 Tax=Thermodesulfovibrio yellowstonii (strain ATCC 51303 / DSM 11347 / YP87) TaxID=289376 RepID=B5YJY8_THEYD|nr:MULTISPECIES: universal stress protein [Thermodesulfovibrio]ACI20836.1 universal stress protein [Thermodesulfovibrio yellowstonii DSM 11347]MDI6864811.1 universal stress protein [Thermodesulfovibrio yellowstonii]